MDEITVHYTRQWRLRREPIYVKQTKEIAELVGGIPTAVAEKFRQARIAVNIEGDNTQWTNHGILFAGDHRQGFEFAPLLAALGQAGRDDAHCISKPFSRNALIIKALGEQADKINLPVIPSRLARDRVDLFNSDFGWKLLQWRRLPKLRDVSMMNRLTISRAAELLADGHIVTLFPGGRVTDATHCQWQQGVGRIIKELPTASLADTRIVLFRFDNFSRTRLLANLVIHSHGLTPKPYTITLRAVQGPAIQLLGSTQWVAEANAAEITKRLHRQFLDAFRGYAFDQVRSAPYVEPDYPPYR
jgi:hypothetical protein